MVEILRVNDILNHLDIPLHCDVSHLVILFGYAVGERVPNGPPRYEVFRENSPLLEPSDLTLVRALDNFR
jgi:hypothetical protein